MKKIIIFMLLITVPVSVFSQVETLKQGKIEHGFYASWPNLKFTQVKESFAFGLGFRGGWIINHSFSLSVGYNLFLTNIKADPLDSHNYGMDSYGIVLEYIFNSGKLVHGTISALIGGGHIGPWHSSYCYYSGYSHSRFLSWRDSDGFYLVEPEIDLIMNISRLVRVGIGASYRFISGVERYGFSNSDLSKFCLNFIFKFGLF